jgi:serine/threonine-protein kinase RsbW
VGGSASGHLSGTRRLRLCHRADATELCRIRRSVRRWAQLNALSEDSLIDLQLAVGEAVANGVEHAYRNTDPGTVDVELEIRDTDGVVAVRVVDHGHWRPVPAVSGYRGRGLALIKQLAERVAVSPTLGGTQVCFEIPLRG